MNLKIILCAAVAVACSSTPAWATVASYTSGATTLKANQDGFDFEIRDEVSDPGGSVRVYISPSVINGRTNCAILTSPINGVDLLSSSVTGVTDFKSPVDGKSVAITREPIVYGDLSCNVDKWFYFSVDSVVQGTALYKVFGTVKSYTLEVTFGPNPADQSKNVVLALRTNGM